MASRLRLVIAASVLAATAVVPAATPAQASTRCDPLVYNSQANRLRATASNGALLIDYHVTVTWCTAPNNSVQVRVYSPQRARGYSVTTAGLLAGYRFDRVLSEKRSYYTYNHVRYGGYYVNTRVNFVRCLPQIIPVCTNKSGWLNTYVRYDRTAVAVRGWD